MKRIKDYTNVELLEHIERLCFLTTNYPHNKTHHANLDRAEREIAKRLGITKEELEEMHLRV